MTIETELELIKEKLSHCSTKEELQIAIMSLNDTIASLERQTAYQQDLLRDNHKALTKRSNIGIMLASVFSIIITFLVTYFINDITLHL